MNIPSTTILDFDDAQIADITTALVQKHGSINRARIERSVRQAASLWHNEDGNFEYFKKFCLNNFLIDPKQLEALFDRFQDNVEQILGHLHEIRRFIRKPTDLEMGDVLGIDRMFAQYDPGAHLLDDLYDTKISFLILLNFQHYTLDELLESGSSFDRKQWAFARGAEMVSSRVPAEVSQKITAAFVRADDYISNYNIFMHNLLTADETRLFPKDLKLISHWGLRDELKAQYAEPDGLAKQRIIHKVMGKIIEQQIPASVVNKPSDWKVDSVINEKDREPDTRYEHLLSVFKAVKLADPYYPTMPTYIDRKFKSEREIPQKEVETLLTDVLSAPIMADIGKIAQKRMGRPLEPFDIWYDGFATRGSISQQKLDAAVKAKYPAPDSFQQKLPDLLVQIGFDKKTAQFLSSKIVVDPARGAGHATGAERREDKAHLRTRIPADGMDYKGYNIAVHELGHNVEQVFSLNGIDEYLLNGVPNTAFTEGFAFAFQALDLKLLGLEEDDPMAKHLKVLDAIWGVYEIAGVAMVDMQIWNWMYQNPDATAAELKKATIKIAKEIWNKYYFPIFKIKDQPLLAVYSHIIDAGMYIPDYPIGSLIQFQMEQYFAKKDLASEMERMCKIGSVTPQQWMKQAVGAPISAKPLIEAATVAVRALTTKH